MKILITEFITGGGLIAESLPASLLKEGEMMLAAIVRDFCDLPDVQVIVTRDPRCSFDNLSDQIYYHDIKSHYLIELGELCNSVDAVLPIAPESDQILERVTRTILDEKKTLLASHPDVIATTASKLATCELLKRSTIPVIPTCRSGSDLPRSEDGWIVKPDKGVGCDQVVYCETRMGLDQVMPQIPGAVIQPYIKGMPASLSLLCRQGKTIVLGYNEQLIKQQQNFFYYSGSRVNALVEYKNELEQLANAVVAVLPGLWGFVGVDFIMTAQGPVVVEINPRLTTSYAGLRESTGINPAGLLMDTFLQKRLPQIDLSNCKTVDTLLT